MNDETLTDEECDRLSRARVDVAPPRALEERTVAALRERGLIRPSRQRWVAAGVLAAVAAVLLAIALWAVPPRSSVSSTASGPRYMLLLYSGADAPADADSRRREYAQWARDVAATGLTITGEELSDAAREVGTSGGALLLPRGFFIVDAPDFASAERIASTCPHLRYGGRIVIKPIV